MLTHGRKWEVYGTVLCSGSLVNSDVSALLCTPPALQALSLCDLKIALRVVMPLRKSSQVPALPEGGSLEDG